jgi:energy-converting hydrogenase Eha subunit H
VTDKLAKEKAMIKTKKQIELQRSVLNAKLEDVEPRFNQIRRNVWVLTAIVAFLCAISYVFAFLDEQYWLAVALAGLGSIVVVPSASATNSAESQSNIAYGIFISIIIAAIIAAFFAVGGKDAFVLTRTTLVTSGDYNSAFEEFLISIIEVMGITWISLIPFGLAYHFSEAKFKKCVHQLMNSNHSLNG